MSTTPDKTPDRARRRRQSKACTRCRKRKIRCDFHYPACGACVAASAECVGFDSIHGVEKPRSIISHLEEEVARLEQQLKDARAVAEAQDGTAGDRSVGAARSAIDRLSMQLAMATVAPEGPRNESTNLLPLTAKVFFVGSPAPHLHKPVAWEETRQPQAQSPKEASPTTPLSTSAVPISSIPRHVAVIMLKHYCEIYRPQYPAVEEGDLLAAFDRVYDREKIGAPSNFDIFCVHITLAISTTTLMYRDEGRAATATAGFWATAVAHLAQGQWNPWQRVQALQLLTHYGFLNPKDVDCLRCTAAALRQCVQLGLQHELPESQQRHVDEGVLDVRRRLFWHSYSIDVAANVTRCRPCSMPSKDMRVITAEMPVRLSAASATAHVWELRRMEAEITQRLYYPRGDDGDDLDVWHTDICRRLSAWHQATRQSVTLSEKIEFAEIHYHMQRLRLSRPSPRRPVPSSALQQECLAAAVAVLREFDVIARLGKLFYIWHAAHCVVEAGVCLLGVCITATESPSEASQDQRGTTSEARTESVVSPSDVPILSRHLKMFPGILWKIARRWPAVAHHAAALESISLAVVEKLQQWVSPQSTTREPSPSTSTAALKQKLKDMSLISPFPMDEDTARAQEDEQRLRRNDFVAGMDAVENVTDADITAPFDANWALPPLSPGQVLAFSSSATLVDGAPSSADDAVLDWDFAGVGFEEIFAALIQANHEGEETSEMVT
ncbi:hypothetical protein SEUCBS139899_002246 [Sporothrix eucalyptigena]